MKSGKMTDVSLTAAFSTIPGDEAEAIKRLITEVVEQLARDDGGFTRAKLVFTDATSNPLPIYVQ